MNDAGWNNEIRLEACTAGYRVGGHRRLETIARSPRRPASGRCRIRPIRAFAKAIGHVPRPIRLIRTSHLRRRPNRTTTAAGEATRLLGDLVAADANHR